jgi:hypothetical protein
MNKQPHTLAKILTYSGTLPLIGSVLLNQIHISGIDAQYLGSTYAAIIISFICGIHWATYCFYPDKCSHNLLITSNVIALLAWTSLLIPQNIISISLQILCFLSLLILDTKLLKAGIWPKWFYNLRLNATIIVIFCLSAMMVFS